VPGDLLLLAGTAIANEALLTGESTPQWKTPIIDEDLSQRLSIKRDKVHVLFGGTKILQHTGDKAAPVRTPDGGCLAVVLRTGFDTSQGKLMRTILFSQVWRSTSCPFRLGVQVFNSVGMSGILHLLRSWFRSTLFCSFRTPSQGLRKEIWLHLEECRQHVGSPLQLVASPSPFYLGPM
jgi:magnesium-transporting ATPase (P-type)